PPLGPATHLPPVQPLWRPDAPQPPLSEFTLPVKTGAVEPPNDAQTVVGELARAEQELRALREEQVAQEGGSVQDEQTKKRLEILEKQIETLEKLVNLLADQLKKQPSVDKLETQVATLEARSVQAARRDRELAYGLDTLNEHVDAQDRYGPPLP